MTELETQQQTHEHYMRRALELAKQGEALGEVPVGAVIVKDDKIIGEGFNQPISSCDPTAHAEVVALRDAASRIENYRLIDCTLYVTIEPCTMCAGSLIHARIKRLVFGATEPKAGVVGSNDNALLLPHFNHSIETVSGILAEECSTAMSDFFAARRAARKS
ncbi:MAG: tRNA adenosine(34) deaminase TadA [Pseudomonadales bacterium]